MYKFTKTTFVTATADCPKLVWLEEHTSVPFDESKSNNLIMNKGTKAGEKARGLFGDYVLVAFGEREAMAKETERLIAAGEPVICEASFDTPDSFCSVDILKNLGGGHVELYEVKSSTAGDTVQERYLLDIAFQFRAVSLCGYTVDSAYLVEIDGDYVRQGELELDRLFRITDVTEAIAPYLLNMPNLLEAASAVLEAEAEPFDPEAGCGIPYECANKSCGYWEYCSRCLPRPNVFNLNGTRTRREKKMACYGDGIISYEDLVATAALKPNQLVEAEVWLSGEAHIDREPIRDFMRSIYYPLYFLDFETIQPVIPPYDNTRAWQQIPFQYSLHYIECEGGELKHTEFLGAAGTDPRRALAEQLCRDIPKDVCVTAYNKAFECGRIKELADIFPDLSEHLLNIRDHIVDLMVPFQKAWYCTKEMQNSYSIKYVLPALCPGDPELDYHGLDGVHNGVEAMTAFETMAELPPEEQEKLRRSLLSYCGLDTLAMVKVWEKLREV